MSAPRICVVVVVVVGGTCDTWVVFMKRLLTHHWTAYLASHTLCPGVDIVTPVGAWDSRCDSGAPSVRVGRGLQLVLISVCY
jgi:hypothetical protein